MSEIEEKYVFISYNREDTRRVKSVLKALDKANIAYWIDETGIEPSANWARTIKRKVEGASAFVLFQSKAYHRREGSFLHKEIEIAVDHIRRYHPETRWFFTYQLDKVPPPDVTIDTDRNLRDYHVIEAWKAPRRSRKTLVQHLNEILLNPDADLAQLRLTNASDVDGYFLLFSEYDLPSSQVPSEFNIKSFFEDTLDISVLRLPAKRGRTIYFDIPAGEWRLTFVNYSGGGLATIVTRAVFGIAAPIRIASLLDLDIAPRQRIHLNAVTTKNTGPVWSIRPSDYYFTIEKVGD